MQKFICSRIESDETILNLIHALTSVQWNDWLLRSPALAVRKQMIGGIFVMLEMLHESWRRRAWAGAEVWDLGLGD